MAETQKWIVYVPWYYTGLSILLFLDLAWMSHDVDASASGASWRFADPYIFRQRPTAVEWLPIRLQDLVFEFSLSLVETLNKLGVVFGQYKRLRNEIKVVLDVALLLAADVHDHVVFPCQLYAHGEVIHFLVFLKSFVEIWLACCVSPEHVPVMAVRTDQPIKL